MKSTGERFIPEQEEGQIKAEHLSRYQLARLLLSLEGKTVLDIACGTGYGTALLAQKAQHVYGVDISQEAVDYARKYHQCDNTTFLAGNCSAIPMDDASADIVVSFETIEHIENHASFLSEIKRVLRPYGTLIISSPNKRLYTDILKTNNPYHVHELYTEEFVGLMGKHFHHTVQFGQTYMLGSIICPTGETDHQTKGMGDIASGSLVAKEAMFNIIVASDAPLQLNGHYNTLTFDITDTLAPALHHQYEAGYNKCRKTPSFRLGHALLHPFSWLKRK